MDVGIKIPIVMQVQKKQIFQKLTQEEVNTPELGIK